MVVGLVVGAATHVLWDEFSHQGRWGTQHLQVLREPAAGLPGYQWVQYASGLLGALVLLAWAVRWWRRTPPHGPSSGGWTPALALVGVGLVAGLLGALTADAPRQAAFRAATGGGGALALTATILAVAWQLNHRRTKSRTSAAADSG